MSKYMKIWLKEDLYYALGKFSHSTPKETTQYWKVVGRIGKDYLLKHGSNKIIITEKEYMSREKIVKSNFINPYGARYGLQLVNKKPSFWSRFLTLNSTYRI